MNKNLTDSVRRLRAVARNANAMCRFANKRLRDAVLSDSAEFNLAGSDFWIITNDRSDVEKILALAPKGTFWVKEPSRAYEGGIDYQCTIDGVEVKLIVQGDALPPTCRIVEEPVEVPAQPARTVMRKVLKCDVKPEGGYGKTEVAVDSLPAQIEST